MVSYSDEGSLGRRFAAAEVAPTISSGSVRNLAIWLVLGFDLIRLTAVFLATRPVSFLSA